MLGLWKVLRGVFVFRGVAAVWRDHKSCGARSG